MLAKNTGQSFPMPSPAGSPSGSGPTSTSRSSSSRPDSQKAIVIGKGGEVLEEPVGIAVRRTSTLKETYLDLHVKVERHWQNRDEMLNRLGYSAPSLLSFSPLAFVA